MGEVTERDVDDTAVSGETDGSLEAADARDSADADGSAPPGGEVAAVAAGDHDHGAGRSTAWIAWTVAVALAVVAAVAVVQWRSVAGPLDATRDARDAAVDYVLTLSTWDAGSGLEPTYAALVAGASEEFLPEVDEVFGDQQREQLVAADAVSTGTIEDVLAGELESGAVPVVVVVEQFVVTGPSADPAVRTERVALLRMVEQGGTWLVDDLEMLSELQLAEEDQ